MNLVSAVVLSKAGDELNDLLKRLDEERTSVDSLQELTNEFLSLRQSAYKAVPTPHHEEFENASELDMEDCYNNADIRQALRNAVVSTRDWIARSTEGAA